MADDILEFKTRFVFGKYTGIGTVIEMEYDDTDLSIHVREEDEHEDKAATFFLEPEEIDLFIAALKLYKYRILNPRKVGIK